MTKRYFSVSYQDGAAARRSRATWGMIMAQPTAEAIRRLVRPEMAHRSVSSFALEMEGARLAAAAE